MPADDNNPVKGSIDESTTAIIQALKNPEKILHSFCIIVGAASSIAFLMASLSGQITEKAGYEYNDPGAFFLSGILAITLLGCIPLMKNDLARRIATIVSIVVILVWCVFVLLFETTDILDSENSKTLLIVYGFAGRFSSILLGIQWNLHFALNRVSSIARTVAATMLLATAFFLVFSLLDQTAAILWGIVLILMSGILNLITEHHMTSNASSVYSIEQSMSGRGLAKITDTSALRTRVLFFGSRIVYGAIVGFLIGVASYASPLSLNSEPIAIMVVIVICINIVGLPTRKTNRISSLFTIVTLPTLLVIALTISFFTTSLSGLIRLFAMMSEVVWITQLYTQLPTYRDLTKLHPVAFAYGEKLVSLIVFEFVVYATMIFPMKLPQVPGLEVVIAFGFALFAIIVTYSLTRHVIRYHPLYFAEKSPASDNEGASEAIVTIAKVYGLTPKETEVFSYLAHGYSRPYIEKSLYIAKGTAKAHTYRIYQKLGINSQDELIELYKEKSSSGSIHL